MIDLRFPELPCRVEVGGRTYRLDTSFRTWIEFGRMLEERRAWPGVFADDVPEGDWLPAVMEFFKSENPCPHGVPSQTERALDLIADGDMVVAAFQQAYGIDLTVGDMHWHRFKALLANLPESTKLSKVMGYRTYRTPAKGDTNDAAMRRMKRMWSLPEKVDAERREAVLEWADAALPW